MQGKVVLIRRKPLFAMGSRDTRADEDETSQALQVLIKRPQIAQQAVHLLMEDLQTAEGPERQALLSTIEILRRHALAPR